MQTEHQLRHVEHRIDFMKPAWRPLLGLCSICVAVMAPLFILAMRSDSTSVAPIHVPSLPDAFWIYAFFGGLSLSVVLFLVALFVGMRVMLDQVPPPFPDHPANKKRDN